MGGDGLGDTTRLDKEDTSGDDRTSCMGREVDRRPEEGERDHEVTEDTMGRELKGDTNSRPMGGEDQEGLRFGNTDGDGVEMPELRGGLQKPKAKEGLK